MITYEVGMFFFFLFLTLVFFSSEIAVHNFRLIGIKIMFSKNWYKNFRYSCSHYFSDHLLKNFES